MKWEHQVSGGCGVGTLPLPLGGVGRCGVVSVTLTGARAGDSANRWLHCWHSLG